MPIDPESVVVLRGQEIIDDNPNIASQYEAIADATGTPIADMTLANVFVETEARELLVLSAFQARGADATVVLDVLLPLTFERMEEPRSEQIELGGKSVTSLSDDSRPDSPAAYIDARGDTLWVVFGDEADAAAVLEQVPD